MFSRPVFPCSSSLSLRSVEIIYSSVGSIRLSFRSQQWRQSLIARSTTVSSGPSLSFSLRLICRIWGEQGQSALEKASICLLTCGPTGSESLKNLVLGGIGSITIVDGAKVEASDLGNNFMLDEKCIGQSRAKCVCAFLQELNDAVKAKFVEESPAGLIDSNPNFFSQFTVVIATQLLGSSLVKLDEICRKSNVVLVIARSYGLTGLVRISAKEHDVVESKPDHFLDDLRLHNPWPELKQFAETIDLEEKDAVVHKHTPYIVILVKLADKWIQEHNGSLPSTRQEKKEFKDLIKSHMINLDEENYTEAIESAFKVSASHGISSELRQILEDNCVEIDSNSSDFWILVAALKEFIEKDGNGEPPLEGSIPDMTSLTEFYVSLQKIYQAKAESDCNKVGNYVREILKKIGRDSDSIPKSYIKTFCRNARKLKVCRYRTIEEEFNAPILTDIQRYLTDEDYCFSVGFYILLRAVDRFANNYNRLPGVFDGEIEEDASRLKALSVSILNEMGINGSSIPFEDLVQEMCRYAAAEIHPVAAFIGGVASQEVIKLVTKQFVPLTGTLIFNGIDHKSQVLTLYPKISHLVLSIHSFLLLSDFFLSTLKAQPEMLIRSPELGMAVARAGALSKSPYLIALRPSPSLCSAALRRRSSAAVLETVVSSPPPPHSVNGDHEGFEGPKWKILNSEELGIKNAMISKPTRSVLKELKRKGHEVYLVGGCVRDLIMKRTPKDFDVLTTADLFQVKKAFSHCRIVGRRFPICHVYFDDYIVEVSSFHTNALRSKNKMKISKMFLECNEKDIQRWKNCLNRDFTINGLMFNPFSNKVYDYLGGIDDLKKNKLQTVIPPDTSFSEDCARILRAIRIAARLGFNFSRETACSVKDLASSILRLDRGRILMEMNYMLAYGSAEASLRLLWKFGLLELILPIQAAYFVSSGFRRRDKGTNMLLALFANLDGLLAPDRPCDSCLWAGLLAFHASLAHTPRSPLTIATFTLALHNGGDISEAVSIANKITDSHDGTFPELSRSFRLESERDLEREVIDLAESVKEAMDCMMDGEFVWRAMEKYPEAPRSDMVFVPFQVYLKVIRMLECITDRENDRGYKPKMGSTINYAKLSHGSLSEIRYVFARVIFDTVFPLIEDQENSDSVSQD
ncbi:hypothetical protein LUZ60_004867 [Juncus effusus]|nr:hypothetical protein LUZ60_004867 [Juncus effusus]